jgi:hypothetical protein
MSRLIDEDKFFESLYQQVGLCRHCGKRDCAGKQSGVYLPLQISLAAIDKAVTASMANQQATNDKE